MRYAKTDLKGLHLVADTEAGDLVADIVFVHGLVGGCHSTWQHSGKRGSVDFFWPGELAKDLPYCSIWTIRLSGRNHGAR